MSTATREAVPGAEAPRETGARASVVLARESLLVVICSTLLGLLALFVPVQLSSDGWLALVAGRLITREGLPHHDTVAVVTSGRPWVDQQWLGQLAMYGLHAVGGIRLLVGANVVLVCGAFVAAAVVARARGAHPPTVAWVGLIIGLPFLVSALNVRTQSLVYLPFVALVYALSRAEIDTKRALFLLAALVVWANVHGSVLLAASLVVLRGGVGLWEARGRRWRRNHVLWFLVIGPPACVLASPYHVHLVGYYEHTAFNPSFSTYLNQWAPTSFSPISAPLLLALFLTAALLGRSTSDYSLYERCVLGLAIMLGLLAVRNWPFSALLVFILAPVGLDRSMRRRPPRRAPAFGAVIGIATGAAALVGTAAALAAPAANLTRSYEAAAGNAAAAAAARSGAEVYGGIEYSDWLLWTHPELSGRIVFDARYELLRSPEVKRLVLFSNGSGLASPLGSPRVFVLDPKADEQAVRGLRGAVRIVYKTDEAVVAVSR